jgi:hypothetical protein
MQPKIWPTMFLALVGLLALAAVPKTDNAPFRFFHPWLTITANDRRQLDRGEPIARVLPGKDLDVAVFAAVPVGIDGDRLVAWMRRIELLKKSGYVMVIARFSNPPRLEDLASLALDDEELSEIRACRPANCGLKLSAAEMVQLRRAATQAGAAWKPALQQAFREAILDRVRTYAETGRLAAYDDRKEPVWPATRFALILQHLPFLTARVPRFAAHLSGFPQAAAPGVESFLYWSKERLASKAIVSVTHVNILRGLAPDLPDALVATKQIFATHYVNASLGLTAIVRGEPGAFNYLIYLNRSEVDVLAGSLGGLVKWFLQRRLKTEALDVLRGLRKRLEGGEPQLFPNDGALQERPSSPSGESGRLS